MKTVVCKADELGPGEFTSAQLGPIPVVVIRASDGNLSALAAKCLHQGGRLDKGRLYQRTVNASEVGSYVDDPTREVIKCPWHGYEYDVRDGRTVFDPSRCLQTFRVSEQEGEIVVELGQPNAQSA